MKTNAADDYKAQKPLVDSPQRLIDGARAALLADYRGMNCIDFSEAGIARLAWRHVLTGDPVPSDLRPAYRERVQRRAAYLREIKDCVTPRLWQWACARQMVSL